MLEEYFIWKKIFEEADEVDIYNLIKLVICDEAAREYVCDKILELKNKANNMVKLSINIDKDLECYPVALLANEIVEKLISRFK
jgi:hypothetical protein